MVELTQDQVVQLIRSYVISSGGLRELAGRVGVHWRQIDHIVAGRRNPRGKVLAFLGLEVSPTTYRKIRADGS